MADGAVSPETVVLLDLPSDLLLRVLSPLDGTALASACAACGTINNLGTSPLWKRLCDEVGAPKKKGTESSKLRYRQYSETLCHECRLPTRYEFAPLGCRLCEKCERSHPHRYGLATREQLLNECSSTASALQGLSAAALDDLFVQLPSHQCAGFVFFVRSVAAAAAESTAMEEGTPVPDEIEDAHDGTEVGADGTEAADDGTEVGAGEAARSGVPGGGAASDAAVLTPCGGVEASSCADGAETHEERGVTGSCRWEGTSEEGVDGLILGVDSAAEDALSDPDLDLQAARWDAAAADHSRQRSSKNVARADRRAALKEGSKLRKQKVKQEARLRRMGIAVPSSATPDGPPPPPVSHRRAGGLRHARLLPKSAHVGAAREDELSRQFRMLERAFGDGLAGLSGLVLAADTE